MWKKSWTGVGQNMNTKKREALNLFEKRPNPLTVWHTRGGTRTRTGLLPRDFKSLHPPQTSIKQNT